MGPTIQLIQMTLRVERNERKAKAQRRSSMSYSSDSADEKTVHASKQKKRILGDVNLLRRQPQCVCV
jgi:hypothetical protein